MANTCRWPLRRAHETIKYVLQTPLLPLLTVLRFGVLGAAVLAAPRVARMGADAPHRRRSAIRISASASRSADEAPSVIVEALCLAWLVLLGGAAGTGVILWTHLLQGLSCCWRWTLGLNWVRNLAAHTLFQPGRAHDAGEQFERFDQRHRPDLADRAAVSGGAALPRAASPDAQPAVSQPGHGACAPDAATCRPIRPITPPATAATSPPWRAVASARGRPRARSPPSTLADAGLRPALTLARDRAGAAPARRRAARRRLPAGQSAQLSRLARPGRPGERARRADGRRGRPGRRRRPACRSRRSMRDPARGASALSRCSPATAPCRGRRAAGPAAPGHWHPDLLLLPGGRTNVTAADLVPRADPLARWRRRWRGAARRSLGRGDRRAAAALRRPGAGAAALRLLLRRRRGRHASSAAPRTIATAAAARCAAATWPIPGACQARRARPGRPRPTFRRRSWTIEAGTAAAACAARSACCWQPRCCIAPAHSIPTRRGAAGDCA